MRARTLLALAMLLALAAPVALAQDTEQLRRARAALPAEELRAFDVIIARTTAARLPVSPLIDKVLEGSAKGAPAPLIIMAIQHMADRLQRAHVILAPGGTPAEDDVINTAHALARGVPDQAVRALFGAAAKGEAFGLSVHALADLTERGVPVEVALDLLSAWRVRGSEPTVLRNLPIAVDRLVRQGSPPGEAAAAVAANVRAGRPPGPPWVPH